MECGHLINGMNGYMEPCFYAVGDSHPIEVKVDPFANTLPGRQQLDALLWFHLFSSVGTDEHLVLSGDGHFDAREQIINFVKSKYDQLVKDK